MSGGEPGGGDGLVPAPLRAQVRHRAAHRFSVLAGPGSTGRSRRRAPSAASTAGVRGQQGGTGLNRIPAAAVEAARIARTLESSAVRAHGVGLPQATRWIEVQAVLARLEGAPHRACGLWLTAVQHRLRTRSDDAAELRACVDRAYHEWSRVEDTSALYDLAPSLLLLHAQVPGHRPEMADAVQRRLKRRGIAVPTVPA